MGIVWIFGEPKLVLETDRRVILINPEVCPWRSLKQVKFWLPRWGNIFQGNYGSNSDHHWGISSEYARNAKNR